MTWTAQLVPFQYSARGCWPPLLSGVAPTAVQLAAEVQETPVRKLSNGAEAAAIVHGVAALAAAAKHRTKAAVVAAIIRTRRMLISLFHSAPLSHSDLLSDPA